MFNASTITSQRVYMVEKLYAFVGDWKNSPASCCTRRPRPGAERLQLRLFKKRCAWGVYVGIGRIHPHLASLRLLARLALCPQQGELYVSGHGLSHTDLSPTCAMQQGSSAVPTSTTITDTTPRTNATASNRGAQLPRPVSAWRLATSAETIRQAHQLRR